MDSISIGPLSDGKEYTYRPGHDKWFDGDTEVSLLPFMYTSGDFRERPVYFDCDSHKWLDEHMCAMPVGDSVDVDFCFKKKYGLNGEVELMRL